MNQLRGSRRRFLGFRSALRVKRSRGATPIAEFLSLIRFVWDNLPRSRLAVLGVFGGIAAVSAMRLVQPLLSRTLVNAAQSPATTLSRVLFISGGIVALVLVTQLVDNLILYVVHTLNARIAARLKHRVMQKYMALPLASINRLTQGSIAMRYGTDIDLASQSFNSAIVQPLLAAAQFVGALIVLFHVSPTIGLFTSIAATCAAVAQAIRRNVTREIFRNLAVDRTFGHGRMLEVMAGIRIVRGFGREHAERRLQVETNHLCIRKELLARFRHVSIATWWYLFAHSAQIGAIIVGALATRQGTFGFGDLVACILLAGIASAPLQRLISATEKTADDLSAVERIKDLLAQPSDPAFQRAGSSAPARVESLTFASVGFEYEKAVPVLSDISLHVPSGTTVAIVGPSGSGKTTLTNLVARFFEPTSGAILMNGRDIRSFRYAEYRDLISIVQQDVFLFDGTVLENVAYGVPDAPEAEVQRACREANCHAFIMGLPQGYSTRIGERGVRLSGGQRQRLSIARALLANRPILIMDEATSNLETSSELQIQQALASVVRGRTTFIVAHRLSTVVHADIILVLSAGRVVDHGSHEALVRRCPMYRQMVELQFGAPSLAALRHGSADLVPAS